MKKIKLPIELSIEYINEIKTSNINLFNGDAMEMIKNVETNSVDFALLDPDYDKWDNLCDNGFIEEVLRVIKPTGNIICFTKQPFDFNLRNRVNKVFRRKLVWTFTNGGAYCSKRLPLTSHQDIFLLTPFEKISYFQPRTGLPYNPKTKSTKRKSYNYLGYEAEGKEFVMSDEGIWLRDHLHYNKKNTGKIGSKPKELIEILIKCLCPINGVVLDPFFGTGNTADICVETNRDYIGFEILKDRFDKLHQKYKNLLLKESA